VLSYLVPESSLFGFSQHKSVKDSSIDQSTPPRKPPRALYNFFVIQKHPEVRARHPNLQSNEVMPKVAEEWKKMSERKKSDWMKKYNAEKDRYKKYVEALPEGVSLPEEDGLKVKKYPLKKQLAQLQSDLLNLEKSSGKPSKPLRSYFEFCRNARNKNPEVLKMSLKDANSYLAGKWNSLSLTEKEIFNKDFELNQSNFKKSMEEWNLKIESSGVKVEMDSLKEKISAMKRDQMITEKEDELKDMFAKLEKPSAPKTNAFRVFFSEGKLANPNVTLNDLRLKWKGMGNDEKEKFSVQAAAINKSHADEVAAWVTTVEASGQLEAVNKLEAKLLKLKNEASIN